MHKVTLTIKPITFEIDSYFPDIAEEMARQKLRAMFTSGLLPIHEADFSEAKVERCSTKT